MDRRKKHETDPKLGVAYIRMSKDEQKFGVPAQREAITTWANREDVRIASWHVDEGVRGKTPLDSREGFQEAMASITRHSAGLLVVLRRDRLARDVMIAAMVERLLERQGARVVSTDGTSNSEGPEGVLIRGIMDLFAQYESLLIGMRTRAALKVKRDRGEKLGVAPFGFRNEKGIGQLIAEPTELDAIAKITEKRRAGASLRRIVTELNSENVPCRGKKWHLSTVAELVNRSTT
jgi:DNA invertase Pin-like site-specific DNA recombinase